MIDISHRYTDEIICPYCGEKHGDSWERQSDNGEDECQKCWETFEWSRNVEITYSTAKKKP